MSQDLRELFKEERKRHFPMKKGHEARFARKLDKAMGRKKPFTAYMIAASVLVLAGIAAYTYNAINTAEPLPETVVQQEAVATPDGISLGDLSPDLKKIEQYYVANINLELSDLEISEDNKAMVDGFMGRLGELNEEYEALTKELNTMGPNDQTINALINNLQLRLQLLYKLKDKLESLKTLQNESESIQSV